MTLEGRISVRPDQVTMAGDLIRVHYKAPERRQYADTLVMDKTQTINYKQ